ncbi:MAG: branched-chain amino acid ABC transporter permease [Chloroflexota bacterium]|nr:branched-chain amino acid ABC transporter permease [Chloroflexota bacterium]
MKKIKSLPSWLPTLLFALFVYIAVQFVSSRDLISIYWQQVFMYACIMAISALGLNLIYGYTGLFHLGQAAFYGIGGYASALITYYWVRKGPEILIDFLIFHFDLGRIIVFLLALLAGALLAAIVGYLIGLPVLSLRSDYLCIATLGFNIIVYVLFNNADKLIPVMKGARGMVGIPRWTSWPWVFAFTVLAIIGLRNLVYSSIGRAIISVREDEDAANVMGIDTAKYKTVAFVVGSLYAGLAGGLYAHLYTFLHPTCFAWIKSVDPFLIVIFGGAGSMTGTIVASFVWTFILEGLRVVLPMGFESWRYVIYPVLLLIIMLFRPEGMFARRELGFLNPSKPRVRAKKKMARVPVAASAGSDRPEEGGSENASTSD